MILPDKGDQLGVHRLLVVEDDPASLSFLTLALTRQGYLVAAAADVTEAREQLSPGRIRSFDCVITDYRMPRSSGLDLLAWIQERDPGLATIIVTAEGAKDLITASFRSGAVDFQEKPIDLRKLLAAVDRAVKHTTRQRRFAETELAIQEVGRTQEWMLGAETARGPVRTSVSFHPQHEAGGDFFSHFQTRPDQLLCLLTDVSGHDVRAAYLSAYFQGIVRGMLESAAPVEEIFATFNQILLQQRQDFGNCPQTQPVVPASIAACALVIDSTAKTVTVFSHGTPTPVHWLPDGTAQLVGGLGGYPLGWFNQFFPEGMVRPVAEGGAFSLWTDGLEDLAQRRGVSSLSLAWALQRAKTGGRRLPELDFATDDVLVVEIQLPPGATGQPAFRPLILEQYHGGQTVQIDELQQFWQRSLRLAAPEVSEAAMHDILLASREALLNALQHGCGGRPLEQACFQAAWCAEERIMRVQVSDPGPGHHFDVAAHEERAARELLDHRRGLILIRHLARRLARERDGAKLTMDFAG